MNLPRTRYYSGNVSIMSGIHDIGKRVNEYQKIQGRAFEAPKKSITRTFLLAYSTHDLVESPNWILDRFSPLLLLFYLI